MTRTKLGLLGLCAVVFGLMAFSATAAQADPLAKWLFAKNEAGTPLIPFLEATGIVETDKGPYVLHSEISKIKVLIECTTISSEGLVFKATGSIGTGARLLYSGCKIFLNGVESKPCEPNDPTTGPGTVRTNGVHGLLKLHKLTSGTIDDVVLVLPDEGETFATVVTGKECAIGTKIPVIGHATIKDCGNLLQHLLRHLIEVMPELTTLWTISKTEEHKATLLGSAWVKLTGPHAGLLFSGDPE